MATLCEDDLCRSPRWFPLQAAGHRAMLFVDLDEETYRQASFLDERLLTRNLAQADCEFSAISAAAARLHRRAAYVFHIGHVGSTLISRLIGSHPQWFSVREPALLRAFADPASTPSWPRLDELLALFARTWRPGQQAVIKTTSIVNEAAVAILGSTDRPAAVFMFVTPLNYLRGILAGPNSRVESRALAPARVRRLSRRLGDTPAAINTEGEQIAMSWLSEMAALYESAKRFPTQVRWVNFDQFLLEPIAGLSAIHRALGSRASSRDIESAVTGPIMRRYSKATEHAYDAALRREVLQSADWEHGGEIKRGLAWLAREAARHPLAAEVLQQGAMNPFE